MYSIVATQGLLVYGYILRLYVSDERHGHWGADVQQRYLVETSTLLSRLVEQPLNSHAQRMHWVLTGEFFKPSTPPPHIDGEHEAGSQPHSVNNV